MDISAESSRIFQRKNSDYLEVKKKDKKLREYLLKQVIELEIKSSGRWIKQITYSAIKIFESGKKVPVKIYP